MSDEPTARRQHQTIRAWADAGGQPAEHPEMHELLHVAGHDRLALRYPRLRHVSAELARLNDPDPFRPISEDEAEDDRLRTVYLWTVELLIDDNLADWFLSGLSVEDVERKREAAEILTRRPYLADLVAVREPFTCMISGLPGGAIALRIHHRTDPHIPPILLDPAAVLQTIRAGMDDLERGLAHASPPNAPDGV